jgi:hypothetical protein
VARAARAKLAASSPAAPALPTALAASIAAAMTAAMTGALGATSLGCGRTRGGDADEAAPLALGTTIPRAAASASGFDPVAVAPSARREGLKGAKQQPTQVDSDLPDDPDEPVPTAPPAGPGHGAPSTPRPPKSPKDLEPIPLPSEDGKPAPTSSAAKGTKL